MEFSTPEDESVAVPFSKGSSQPRYQSQVSRIAGRFFMRAYGFPEDMIHLINESDYDLD